MSQTILGVIHGKTIELKENPGFSDGQEIEVMLRPRRDVVEPVPTGPEERRTAAGMLAHLPPEVDEELDAIVRERRKGAFRVLPE
jgi:hypothetical protein